MTTRPAPKPTELPAAKLRWKCELSRIPFETTAQAELREGFIGQERALRALKMGAELSAPGYNVFVCGLAGTSRGGTIARMVEDLHPPTKESLDRCYVNNFKLTDRPRLLALPRGQANGFKKDMQAGIDFLRRRIPQVFEGEPFQRQKGRIVERFTVREKELMDDFTRRIAREQFALGHMQVGAVALPEIFPVLEGQMVPIEDISKMVHEGKLESPMAEDIERKYEQFRQEFTVVYRKTLTLSRELASELSYLEQEAASVLVDGVIEELKEKYAGPNIAEYLEEVRHHLLDNLDPFKEREGEGEHDEETPDGLPKAQGGPERDPFRVYGVNVILAHSDEDKSPVIFETTPTYANLFGTIQRAYDTRGGWSSDFMDLRGGSLLRADGGFLIMYSLEALSEVGVWRALKRTLNHNRLEIQPLEMFYPFGGSAQKPEAIDINVKVILIGDRSLYELLYEYEEDFRKIFKVRVEFDEEMAMSDGVIAEYAGRLRALSEKENLYPFDRGAFAAMLEYGVRQAGRRNKVTARFIEIADLAREAHYNAAAAGESVVRAAHVRGALSSKMERHNLIETRIREMIQEGTLLVDVEGTRVGQVNGLSVLEIGGYSFGKPVRITATAALGKTGLINIEREANLSGRFHDKGMHIIAGFLRSLFAQDKPLSLAASICFEQSYSGVDGDSASSTEIYALASALSGLPLRQDIAVTGSINQQGDIQAIGGVNEKIEGFFDVCRIKGLTGTQGVMMPESNVEDLMLREDVLEAVTAGKFHVWPVGKVEQGIELLTGMAAGKKNGDGKFEPGTVLALIDERLHAMARTLKEFE
ncbi:MAG TPA: AAA family ATPase [Candidatus Acidoferrales bacterium]|jgi:predicted ATP-dependent protease|nr:AAA family ATPase [Candidatus Acidoferrales bacterium]HYS22541.1 AAA family ATPase [Candidatus Eisenbacteria bacterium]